MKYVLGLDLGTSSLKGLLVNRQGKVVAEASADYPLITPAFGFSEQAPSEWLAAADKVMAKIIALQPASKNSIEAISFSGQMHSLVMLDENDKVIRNAILWNDVRTTKQCEEISEALGDRLIEITKNRALEGFTLPKILWVKENEPENFSKLKTFLLPKDYLGFYLTGNKHMEYSDAAGTLLLEIESRRWSEEILHTFGISPLVCPALANSTDCIGELSEELKVKWGLEGEIKIYGGGADNACGAIGAGILEETTAMCSIGTSGVFLSYEPDLKNTYKGELHFFNHGISDAAYSMGVTLSAGNSLSWFRQTFAPQTSFEELTKLAENTAGSSAPLLFSPYIMGERTPYPDSQIRGSFIGMDVSHTLGHFVQAVLEGITFSLKDSQKIMEQVAGKKFQKIVSVGGGSKSAHWLQLQADIFGCNIVVLSGEQGPAMGAVMIAAVGAGWFESFAQCAKVFVEYGGEITPNAAKVEYYEELYAQYRKIYPNTKDICRWLNTAHRE